MAKKKYSINWEDDVAVSFEVNGVEYGSLDAIPDEKDRLKLEAMMDSTFDAEFEKMGKDTQPSSGFPMEKVVLSIFSGVAILMLLITGIVSFTNIQKINREVSTPGRVIDMIMERSYVNEQDRIVEEYYFPVVEYTSNDGKYHKVKMSEGSSSPSYEVGDDVIVLYEPEHPLDARIKSLGSSALMWILPTITGIIGLGFLGAVIVVLKVMSSSQEQSPSVAR